MDLLDVIADVLDYAVQMIPMAALALAALLALRPARMRRLEGLGLASGPWREGALALFVAFCAGLAALTLFPADFWTAARWAAVLWGERPLFPPVDWHIQWANLQTTPFQEIWRAFRGPWVMFLMVGNIAMFVPMGFFPALLWRGWRWWRALALGFGVSFAIECVQFFIGRSTDVDDVILNTAGALLGFWLLCLVRALVPGLCAKFQCREQ